MNVFNRIIMTIAMLALIVFSIVAIINIFVGFFVWSTVADSIISYATNLNPYISAGILFLILVIALIIFISEFSRRKIKLANISTDSSGKTMVNIKTAEIQIKESLNNIQDMIDPSVKITPKQNGVSINIFSKLVAGVNVTDKTKEIREAASNFASNSLGFKVSQTNYTAIGFITKKAREVKIIKEEIPKEVIAVKEIPQDVKTVEKKQEEVMIVEEVPEEVKVIEEDKPKEANQEEQIYNKTEY